MFCAFRIKYSVMLEAFKQVDKLINDKLLTKKQD